MHIERRATRFKYNVCINGNDSSIQKTKLGAEIGLRILLNQDAAVVEEAEAVAVAVTVAVGGAAGATPVKICSTSI